MFWLSRGFFREALNVRASDINNEMNIAAAHAIANMVKAENLKGGI